MALLVIALGALVLALTYGPVPVKSKMAFLYPLSIVSFRLSGVPSSMYSHVSIECTGSKLLEREKLQSMLATDSAAF